MTPTADDINAAAQAVISDLTTKAVRDESRRRRPSKDDAPRTYMSQSAAQPLPVRESCGKQGSYYAPFVVRVSAHGVRSIDCDALARALKAGAQYNDMTREWEGLPDAA